MIMSGFIQKSLHGVKAFVDPYNLLFGRSGIATGGREKPMVVLPGSPDVVALWDDFVGDTGRSLRAGTDSHWRILDGDTGTDTGSNVYVTPGTGGILRFRNGDTPIAKSKMGITGSLMWKGNQGSIPTDNKTPLRMGARLKIAQIDSDTGTSELKDTGQSNVNVWVGFTDTVASETPVMDTGGVIISTATDAVGIAYGSRNTNGGDTGWVGYNVNSGTDGTPVVLGVTPTANTYNTVEVEIHHGISDTGGTASFYVDGQLKGSVASPIAMNVALAPQILMWGDSGGGVQVDVDWVNVSAPRDTGK
jgi:hypothetical protein